MKTSFFSVLLGLVIVATSCSNDTSVGRKFFDYDEIEYYFNSLDGSKLEEILMFDIQSMSELDSIKNVVIFGGVPQDIHDLSFINKLEEIGYKHREIDPSKFSSIDSLFREKKAEEYLETSCLTVYRDILVFRKKNNVVGVAKVCFDCFANQIVGAKGNTMSFGQDGDYFILKDLLRKEN